METLTHVRYLTDQDFDEVVGKAAGLAMVDFTAAWCSACRAAWPTVEAMAADLAGSVLVAAVDVDASPATASRFGVRSLPTFLFFRDGKEVGRIVGFVPRSALEAQLAQLG